MGEPLGGSVQGEPARHRPGWRKDDPGSSGALRNFLAGGEPSRFKRKHPLPSGGDRFGQLTVFGVEGSGDSLCIRVQCDCGAIAHTVLLSNLVRGKTTRCNACAKLQARRTVQKYLGFADIVPDNNERKRLMGRFSAAVSRCHNPLNAGYASYGARGIFVDPKWRANKRLFLEHVIGLPGWRDATLDIDRIDVDGPYGPGNIRFVTRSENAKNKRRVDTLSQRVLELERRLRHCTCGASEQVHDPHG